MNTLYTGKFNVSLKNKNSLLETGKGWGLNLVYTTADRRSHVVMVDYKHYDSLPDMQQMQVLVAQINQKHNDAGFFNATLAAYFGDVLAIEKPIDNTVTPALPAPTDIKSRSIIIHGERVTLTPETILKTRLHFSGNAQACIDEVLSSDVTVNNQSEYFTDCKQREQRVLSGDEDTYLYFLQHAYFIQAGECVPFFE